MPRSLTAFAKAPISYRLAYSGSSAVGKVRPPFSDDVQHYQRLLARHARVTLIEVREDEQVERRITLQRGGRAGVHHQYLPLRDDYASRGGGCRGPWQRLRRPGRAPYIKRRTESLVQRTNSLTPPRHIPRIAGLCRPNPKPGRA